MRRGLRAAFLFMLVAPCGAARADTLSVAANDPRLLARPDLRDHLLASAHGYFRFVNAAFAVEACSLFADVVASMPEVNLHGDAHVEQYAVTSLGRGLTDFDDCSKGKPIIDLVRFGTSLLLAAREKGWQKDEMRFVDEFLRGYRDALKKPTRTSRTPHLVTRVRGSFTWNRRSALAQAHAFIDAAPAETQAFEDIAARFAFLVGTGRADLPPGFFTLKRVGTLRMGVGSALDEKYLLIFEGFSQADADDLIVEAKQIRDLSGNPCVRTDVGSSRVLDGQKFIAYEPFPFAAVVPHDGKYFWVHDWTDDYQEASIAEVILSPQDLSELAYDAGLQLGRAHPKRRDGTPDRALQRAALHTLALHDAALRSAIRTLAERTQAAWRRFRDQAAKEPAGDASGP